MTTMPDNALTAPLATALDALAEAEGFTWTRDAHGNAYGWLRLAERDTLPEAARLLAEGGARLATVTAYDPVREPGVPRQEIAYHFDVHGTTLTVTVVLDPECPSVPSITPHFRNADWDEREFMEMYDIAVPGHPNPRRLFLDEKLDAGIMNTIIPLSTMTNGASTQNLWERILAARPGDKA